MTVQHKDIDVGRSLKIIAEITRTCKLLRNGYLEGRKEELMKIFQEYETRSDQIDRPDNDAVTLGFREAWRQGDYTAIVKVGKFLTKDFFEFNREAEAFYLAAKKRMHEKNK